jgi:Tol biopolymer transport system component
MNARTKAVGIWTALAGAIVAGVMLFGPSAESGLVELTPPVELVSLSFMGGQPNGNSSGAVTSGDGTCVAYYTDATNILPTSNGDSNGFTDVYVFNRADGVTTRVSVGFDGQNPNGPSMAQRFRPSIDSGCTCVAFSSDATNLVPDDTNRKTDVFVRDLPGQTTELASRGLNGEPADGASSFTSVPEGCGEVAFHSVATNLVDGDTNDFSDVFVFNRASGETRRVSVGPGGEQANGPSITPSFSADGRCVAFASAATNLLPVPGPGAPDTNGTLDIYVECDGVVTCRASVSSDGTEANNLSFLPALNGDGTIVAFKSNASNLVPDDFNTFADVFVHNCTTGETVRASVGNEGQEGNDIAIPPSISRDGRFVAFGSFASNLISGVNTNSFSQVYVRDLVNNTTSLISTTPLGQPGNGSVPDLPPSISLDGGWVAFESLANNLVPGDNQGYLDAFIRQNVTVGPTGTPTDTPPPEQTPTPRIPCNEDGDCPVGQVCGPDKICVPAPTPTPTIHCENDEDCPDGLKCVNNVCRDLSTPTATPTPLPTCVTDEDCPDDSCVSPPCVCRAFVCVPHRPCDDVAECRGIRELCLDDFCECGGDCNLDGIVFGTEITDMICIWGGDCPLEECRAGDLTGDGEITMTDVTLAVTNLGLGCPGEGTPLIFAEQRQNETRTMEVGNISGIPGEFVEIDINMNGGDEVTTAQADMFIDTSLLQVSITEPVCTLDARIPAADGFRAEVRLPQNPPGLPPGILRLRTAVVDVMPPANSFGPGPILHCKFRINPAAAPQMSQIVYDLQRLEIGDPQHAKFNAEITGGAIEIKQRPPCETNDMCPLGTECKGGECRPIIECSGPMAGPAECLDGRQACVNGFCQCVGDCDNNGIVRSNEISTMIAIINDQQPLSVCLAADFNGDEIIRSNEISIAIENINQGCP